MDRILAHPSALSVLRGAMGRREIPVALFLIGEIHLDGWRWGLLTFIISSYVIGGVYIFEQGLSLAAV
jgi:hypothetical protein